MSDLQQRAAFRRGSNHVVSLSERARDRLLDENVNHRFPAGRTQGHNATRSARQTNSIDLANEFSPVRSTRHFFQLRSRELSPR